MIEKWLSPATAIVVVLAARIAAADDAEPIQVHAFVSQGALLSVHNNVFADTKDGSFEFFEAGVNGTKQLTQDLTVGVQLFARDLGPVGDYKPRFDWAYFDYHWRDWLGLRAGRIKLPYGLYNDVADVDAARATILLPQSLYPLVDREYLLAQTGFELYGFRDFHDFGALQYRAYAGTIYAGTTTPGLDIPYMAGFRLIWETPLTGLRVAANMNRLKVELDQAPLEANAEATVAIASAEYEVDNLTLSSEYSRWYTTTHSNNEAVIPRSRSISERAYLQLAYHVTPWFAPAAYYSVLFPDIHHREDGRDSRNHDAAVSVRFDLNRYWIFKLEAHYERGTAGLDPTLNDNIPTGQLAETWWLFAAKTTVYF